MSGVVSTADRWLFGEYRASTRDLAAARILLAAYLLLQTLPQGHWVGDLPDTFVDAPLSLAALWRTFPSEGVMLALNAAAFAAAACLLIGYRTVLASVVTTVTLVALHSFVFATGKIDHSILTVVAPAIMATSGWGDTWSVDARQQRSGTLAEPDRTRRRWQLAWLALVIAVAISSSGLAKLNGGWLSLDVSSSYGHVLSNAVRASRDTWLGGLLLGMPGSWLWEASDWGTVAVELAGVVAVWRRRWFNVWCVSLAAFHVVVALQMDIWFSGNLVVYAVFLPWCVMLRQVRVPSWSAQAAIALALGGAVLRGLVIWTVDMRSIPTWLSRPVGTLVVLAAVPVSVWAWQAAQGTARIRSVSVWTSRDGSTPVGAPARGRPRSTAPAHGTARPIPRDAPSGGRAPASSRRGPRPSRRRSGRGTAPG